MLERMRSWVWREATSGPRNGELVGPAFSSVSQAVIFVALIVTCITLPIILDFTGQITRRHSYDLVPERHGAFSLAKEWIFNKEKEVDLLFIGSSTVFASFDTPRVQQELTREMGETVHAMTFGHYFNSFDITYMQVRDLLQEKRPKMIVLSVPRIPYSDGPSALAYKFIRYSENRELLSPVPSRYQASLYACTILRSPSDLLSMARPHLSRPSKWAASQGADKTLAAMGRDFSKFRKFEPPVPEIAAHKMTYSRQTRNEFEFSDEPIGDYQELYLKKLIELLAEKEVPVVFVSIPTYSERYSTKVISRGNWAEKFPTAAGMIGVPPAVLFDGLTDQEIESLFFDKDHLNANGNRLFTEALLPAIRELYRINARKD